VYKILGAVCFLLASCWCGFPQAINDCEIFTQCSTSTGTTNQGKTECSINYDYLTCGGNNGGGNAGCINQDNGDGCAVTDCSWLVSRSLVLVVSAVIQRVGRIAMVPFVAYRSNVKAVTLIPLRPPHQFHVANKTTLALPLTIVVPIFTVMAEPALRALSPPPIAKKALKSGALVSAGASRTNLYVI